MARPVACLLPLALSLLLSPWLSACADPVTQARLDSAPPTAPLRPLAPLPEGLSLEPEDQLCLGDEPCYVARGLPGRRRRDLCCASCQGGVVALSRENHQRLESWRRSLRCSQIACPPLGDCLEQAQPLGAACQGGRCVLFYEEGE